jgi:hypothetical protein
MKKLLLILTLTATMSQAFAAAGFLVATANLANGGDESAGIGLGGLSTTTTTSVYASPIAGLVVFLDGKPAVNLASDEAQTIIAIAMDKEDNGVMLSEDEAAILDMVASHE